MGSKTLLYAVFIRPEQVVHFLLCRYRNIPQQIQSRYGLETRPASLFYLFVRVYADLRTVKTMNFWYNEAIVQ